MSINGQFLISYTLNFKQMDFFYNEQQLLIQQSVREFAQKNILPHVMEWDESQEFPISLFKEMGKIGLMGILVPEEYGGAGLGYFEYILALEEVSKVCGSIGLSMAAHNSLCTNHILMFGTESQKKTYLPKLVSGEWIGAWGLTEANTGSDSGNMKTTVIQDGDYFIINGSKNFITHGKSASVAVILAKHILPNNEKGSSAFIIEKGTPGFKSGRKENKMGMRASETTELIFEDVRIHKSQILGEAGDGFKQAMKILDGGRISIAALSLGIAQGAYEAAKKYSKERIQFNQPIHQFQGISFKLVDMAMEIEAARLLTYKAADMKMKGLPMTKEAAMAKLLASEVAVKTANEALQVFGGYGFTKDYPAEKFYRDAKLCTIGEGTSEIQKIVIAKSLIK
jgi:alkylation response protein AidB-like acyl-CoA dehydrogenase